MSLNVEDRLSSLPEEIVSHILSLMPTIYAVRTSILSKRWRNSWTLVTNLDFDDAHSSPYGHIFTKFVDQVLKHCKTSQVKLFRLVHTQVQVQKSSILRWIDKAVALSVCELDIRISIILHEFPLSFYTCTTLTILRLHSVFTEWECPSSVNFPRLKNLDIFVCRSPFANAFKLIRGCPMLESLSFKLICYTKEDWIFNIPTLKRLELELGSVGYIGIKKVILNVPNLEYLFVRGNLGSLFVMEDLSSLVEASTDYIKYDHLLVELLKGVSGVKSLSVKHISSTLLLPVFPNLKRLELEVVWQYELISMFLESSPVLEHLCIKKEKRYKSSWIEPKLVPTCMLTNLTSIKVLNCNKRKCDIEFLEYILRNAKVLKRLTIIPDRLCWENDVSWLYAQLVKVPRASPNCVILFLGKYSRGLR